MLTQESGALTDADSITRQAIAAGEGPYGWLFQPHYPDADHDALRATVEELQGMEGVTTPRNIDNIKRRLAQSAFIVMTGRCNEPVVPEAHRDMLAQEMVNTRDLVLSVSGLEGAVVVLRAEGQNFKPRSSETEERADGTLIGSYKGDGINGHDPSERTPDPRRLVKVAQQASYLEKKTTQMVGEHIPVGHEVLSLVYDKPFVRVDSETGKKYLLSADVPWVGKRTNWLQDKDGRPNPIIEMLAEVENPVGVKIGADSTPEHIKGLKEKLNPNSEPGKLIFMLRTGPDNIEQLKVIVGAIKEFAPESLVEFDIHGSTDTDENGKKIRAVSTITAHINQTAQICRDAGLEFGGVHLESVGDNREECVYTPDQIPAHKPVVDPQLNPDQLRVVLENVAPVLTQGSQ
jgi:3-deoxy-7-phosphoheptulonate synthase